MSHIADFSLSRRKFLTATTSLAALGAVGSTLPVGVSSALAAEGPKEILSGSHFGVFYGTTEDGRLKKIPPWEKDPHPTPKLNGVKDLVYDPSRIKYPMVRRAYLENGVKADRSTRGNGDFVRVSWDKALDLVANEIKRLETDEGPWSLYAGSYGWRSSGRFGNPQNMLKRFMNKAGGAVLSFSNYSNGALIDILPFVLGSMGLGAPDSYPTILDNTDLLVYWGSDPLKNNQIDMQLPDHSSWAYIDELKKRGKKCIFINPVKVEACKTVDGEWIAIRPQTDVAMILGICHELYTEKLCDTDFLENYTFGFDKFAEYLTGKTGDKIEKTPEWAAEKCGIAAKDIRDLAHRLVAGRTMIFNGWASQRQHHGEQVPWAIVTLASMIGQIGLPGGGFSFGHHSGNSGSPMTDAPALSSEVPIGTRTENKPWPEDKGTQAIPCARVVDMLENPGKTFEYKGKNELYPDVKLAYWVGGNPFHHHQDRNRMRKAWEKLETFIVQDFQWTATARFADIVLPATTTTEREDIELIGSTSKLGYLAMKKVVDPVFETKTDYDIFSELSKRLGIEKDFTQGKSPMDYIKGIYAKAKETADAQKKVTMPDFETFWEKGLVEFDIPEKNQQRATYTDFREDPLMNMLPTETGKIQIYSTTIEKFGYDDCPAHVTWLEPEEWLGQEDKTYPLDLDSNHPNLRLHSQLCGTKVRELYAVNGHEPCLVNTKDAEARGIKDGDILRVFNGRGQILTGAIVTDDIRPGVIRVQEGAWYDPEDITDPKTLCKYGDPNVLSIDIGTSRLAQATSAHTCMVEIEKFTGTVPEVTAFVAPKAAAE